MRKSGYMKIIMFLALVVMAISCSKDESPEECWTCSTTTNGGKLVENRKVCDPVEAAALDGKRVLKTEWNGDVATVTTYNTKCKK